MGKNPAFQFYPSDWARDLEEHPLEIEGAWIRICCKLWWEDVRGKATKTLTQWSRILRVGEKKSFAIIAYLDKQKIADVVISEDSITISSRRMMHDEVIRKIRSLSGSKGGNPLLKESSKQKCLDNQTLVIQNPTPSSSSSTSIKKEIEKKEKRKLTLTDEEWMNEIKNNPAYKSINVEIEKGKCEAWCLTNGKIMSRRRLVNWLNRAEKPLGGGYGGKQGGSGERKGGPGVCSREGEPSPTISDDERARNIERVRSIVAGIGRGIQTG